LPDKSLGVAEQLSATTSRRANAVTTLRAYAADWHPFTAWCFRHRCRPAARGSGKW
jgi:hypothetical protein